MPTITLTKFADVPLNERLERRRGFLVRPMTTSDPVCGASVTLNQAL